MFEEVEASRSKRACCCCCLSTDKEWAGDNTVSDLRWWVANEERRGDEDEEDWDLTKGGGWYCVPRFNDRAGEAERGLAEGARGEG